MKDLLLQLCSYPTPTPRWAIETAAELAQRQQALLSGGLCRVNIPHVSDYLADKLISANETVAVENAKSQANARALQAEFAEIVGSDHIGVQFVIEYGATVTGLQLAQRARTFDLLLLPLIGNPETRYVCEDVIFGSGRPVLLLPRPSSTFRNDRVVIGWDGSTAAARAMADALPLCLGAKKVHLVTITGEKDLSDVPDAAEAMGHLERHGIDAEVREISGEGSDVGSALLIHCASTEADLLVMGAYGHSRFREFVLGGATRTVLERASIPTLLSH